MTHKAQRGMFELKQGRALCVLDDAQDTRALVAAVEGIVPERVRQMREAGGPLRLVVTQERARAMGISGHADHPSVAIALGGDETPETLMALATERLEPRADSERPSAVRPATRAESAGLALARHGYLVPAVLSAEVGDDTSLVDGWLDDGAILDASCAQIEHLVAHAGIEITRVAEASVPLADAEHTRFVFFREAGGFLEHVAVLVGPREEWPEPLPVRLHSACLTGDIFSSLRCDCGEQLKGSLRHFEERGGGVLVYLAQEGRSIGLGNKMRAYALQEQGLDTVDADGVLGFGPDERRYDAAVAILRHLDIQRVALLTNNPDKVRAVEEAGIDVVERTPLYGDINRHNLRYVQSKVDRSGHWLTEMIAQHASGD